MAYKFIWDGTLSPNDFEVSAKKLIERWARCSSISKSWKWQDCPDLAFGASNFAKGYLSLETVTFHKPTTLNPLIDDLNELDKPLELSDPATLIQNNDHVLHLYTYHVVYSHSYRVPMLLFRGQFLDGRLLELEDIEKDLPLYSCQALKESKWTFLTQEEHPYLNEVWYCLHPCGTSEWVRFLFSSNSSTVCSPELLEHLAQLDINTKERKYNRNDYLFKSYEGKTGFLKDADKEERNVNAASKESICQQYLISWLSVVGQVVGLKVPLEISRVTP